MTEFLFKLFAAALILGVSALFSLAETAFMSLSRLQLDRLEKLRPGRLAFWRNDPDRALAALLLMNNVANAGLGVLSVSLALDAAAFLGVPFQQGRLLFPLATALLVILLGEVAPKVFARSRPEPLAMALAPMTRFLSRRFGPLMDFLLKRTGRALSFLSRTVRTEKAQWDPAILRHLLEKSSVDRPIRRVLENLVEFGHRPVTAVMVPRSEMRAVDLRLDRNALVARVLETGHSRVPVHRGSLDAVQGMIYAKDLLAEQRSAALIAADDLVRPLPRVAPQMSLAELMREFRQGHHHMALVVDRLGGVLGLVTLQDALEAIVGDIASEPGPA